MVLLFLQVPLYHDNNIMVMYGYFSTGMVLLKGLDFFFFLFHQFPACCVYIDEYVNRHIATYCVLKGVPLIVGLVCQILSTHDYS